MKFIKLFTAGVIALGVLAACTGTEPENNTLTNYEAYYAANASLSSGYSEYSATETGGSILFGPDGGSVVIKVNCGTDWVMENSASDLFDAVVSDGSVTVSAEQNRAVETVSGVITLSTSESHITFATINVSQEAYDAPEITVETTSWHAPALGELTTEISITVRSGELVVDSVSEEWLTAVVTDDGVSLTAQENGVAEVRSAKVVVSNTIGTRTETATISVTQDARAYVTLDSANGIVLPAGGSLSATVESNYDWTCSTSDSWLTVEESGNSLTMTAAQNSTGTDRTGTVTVTAGDGAENYSETTYTVTQLGGPDPLILEYTTTTANIKITLPLDGTVDCTVYWGDGEIETVTSSLPNHTYEKKGTYDVWVTGTVTALTSEELFSLSSPNTTLTAVKAWGSTGLTDMSNAFNYCEGLKTIPTDTAGSFSEVTAFYGTFYYCENLQNIPEGLLDYATKVTTMSCAFSYCKKVPSIPDGLFDNCPLITDFSFAFYACFKIEAIPSGLFDHCPEIVNFEAAFFQCLELTSIPSGLFDYNTKVEDFSWVFAWSHAIASIPEGLFDNCPEVTDFSYAFYTLYDLEEIPAHLFDHNPKVTSFSHLFSFASILTSVPGHLFDYCPEVTEMDYLFYCCKQLKTIPDDLFKYNTKATTFARAFCECFPLTSIPAGIFDSCPDVTSFYQTFAQDSALTCESPYTELSDGSKIHLYNRLDSEYRSYYPNVTKIISEDCFYECDGLTDYDSIPAEWGGGAAASSISTSAVRTTEVYETVSPPLD